MASIVDGTPLVAAPQTPPARARLPDVLDFSPSKRRRLRKSATSHRFWMRTRWHVLAEEVPSSPGAAVFVDERIPGVAPCIPTSSVPCSAVWVDERLLGETPCIPTSSASCSAVLVDERILGEAPCFPTSSAPCSAALVDECILGEAPCIPASLAPCSAGFVDEWILGEAPCIPTPLSPSSSASVAGVWRTLDIVEADSDEVDSSFSFPNAAGLLEGLDAIFKVYSREIANCTRGRDPVPLRDSLAVFLASGMSCEDIQLAASTRVMDFVGL
mmetsp:Transcript_21359/g.60503  ORF Transcript_21359/g.60503 Transcript_21359/m.60503 type:complete len:272 (+) Transcript_21359:52-867(+)